MPDPISWDYSLPYYLAAMIGGYLLGATPFGLLLTKAAGHGDIRFIGSGNIGATNVLRTGNKPLALLTLLLDGGKGAVAVLLASGWGPDVMLIAGFAAVLGHLFPVWLKFKGGKGVATTLGTMIAVAWPLGLAACATWLAAALIFRISSLSALIALASAPLWSWYLLGDLQVAEFSGILALLVWWRHKENIARLLKGEEPRIGGSKKSAPEK